MSPRKQEMNEKVRNEAIKKIKRAALQVFAEYGYHGATMNRIVALSKVSKGLVYHYFTSKEEILFHLVKSALKLSKDAWDRAINNSSSSWEKIVMYSTHLFQISFCDENSLYLLLMLQALTQGKSIPGIWDYIENNSTHYDQLENLIREAQESGDAIEGDPEVLSLSFYAMFQGYILHFFHDREVLNKISPQTFFGFLKRRL